MSEQYNAELVEMLQKAVEFKRNYWHDDANQLLKKILGDKWPDEFWKKRFAEDDLRWELSDGY